MKDASSYFAVAGIGSTVAIDLSSYSYLKATILSTTMQNVYQAGYVFIYYQKRDLLSYTSGYALNTHDANGGWYEIGQNDWNFSLDISWANGPFYIDVYAGNSGGGGNVSTPTLTNQNGQLSTRVSETPHNQIMGFVATKIWLE